jgi:hypothetical protein
MATDKLREVQKLLPPKSKSPLENWLTSVFVTGTKIVEGVHDAVLEAIARAWDEGSSARKTEKNPYRDEHGKACPKKREKL